MSFKVTLRPSGKVFEVGPRDRLLQTAQGCGIKLASGCRMGTCRSCRGLVLSGEYDLGAAHPAYLPQEDRDKGYALLCQATARTDLEIEIDELPALSDPMIAPAIVKSIDFVTKDIAIVRLRLPLHMNMLFAGGQFIDFLLEDGLRRSYSIASPPRAQGVIDLELHFKHMPGGRFTDYVFNTMKVRDKVQFEGPLGGFYMREGDGPVLLLATGTGYAPIRSMLLENLPTQPDRPMHFYWGARTKEDLYLFDEATELASQYPNLTFTPVLSRGADQWSGTRGHVQDIAVSAHPDMTGWQVYACGSPTMVEQARKLLVGQHGVAERDYHADPFTSTADLLGMAISGAAS